MKTVLLFCDHVLPEGHPNATRMISLAKILKLINFNVFMLGVDSGEEQTLEGIYDGVRYCVLPESNLSGAFSVYKSKYNARKRTMNWIESFCSNNNVELIISFGSYTAYGHKLLNFTRKNKIKLAESVCEWYDCKSFGGRFGYLKYLLNRYSLIILYPRMRNIITISRLLENYYRKKGCNTIRIPTILDIDKYQEVNFPANDKLVLVYAGSPVKKDYISNVILAIYALGEEERKKVEFRIFGTDRKFISTELEVSEAILDELKTSVHINGVIPYSCVKEELKKADFSVLLRPNKRYANAGFPTKVGESMAAGVPVIANLTSDIGLYLEDERQGLICEDCSVHSCTKVIQRALQLSNEKKMFMRLSAYEVAKNVFNYKTYIESLSKFIANM
ncbi:MAG: hypothetical protein CVV03_08005 [Firmicutes bacterium HGW-Firmicutes-8]|nr:MAG: hypothetical protein CVV03_08005 [Firmicutes bacterium HGW-Firmicutes-8]